MAEAPDFFLNTYTPLVISPFGRTAAKVNGLPPFIDGSIRREPDLAHEWPSISCLCRAGKFAPRLREGHLIAYLTRKGRYGDEPARHWRLTAVLKAEKIFPDHELAAEWYRKQKITLPSNCMVDGNGPIALEFSHRKTRYSSCIGSSRLFRAWDAAYRRRARKHPAFVVCSVLFRDLSWRAPVVHEDDLIHAFGYVPCTQNPPELPVARLHRLMSRLGLPALPSSS